MKITYIYCYENKDGYYFDVESLEYKLCYTSCKKCNISGNDNEHNCIECKEGYNNEIYLSIYKNCLEKEIENKTELIQNMINNIFEQLNITDIDNGIDKKLNEKNISVIITSTKNQKKNENEKIITMNLSQCENILKIIYNITENDTLYILLIIAEEEGMNISKIEYEIYYPFNDVNNNFTKLNLNVCKETKIEISIPIKIDDNLDKYNPKSNYYNDICYKTTSESGTDISLKDRRNEFIENNMTLCEENCDLIDYNYTNEKVKCSCDIKININHDFKFNTKEFYKSFIDIKNILNINIIKYNKML